MLAGLRMAGLNLESMDGRGELRPEEVDGVFRCPLILKRLLSAEPLATGSACVDTEDIDDASESLPPVIELIRFDAVELVLFFFGRGGNANGIQRIGLSFIATRV